MTNESASLWPLDEDGNPTCRVREGEPYAGAVWEVPTWQPEGLRLLETLTHQSSLGGEAEFQVMRDAVKTGLPWEAFDRLRDALEVNTGELCALTGIAHRTLNRRKGQPFTPDESEKLLRFGRVYQKALEVLESPAGARRWLKSPKHALGGLTPLVCTDTEAGAREVEALLMRLEHGVFS